MMIVTPKYNIKYKKINVHLEYLFFLVYNIQVINRKVNIISKYTYK